MTKIVEESNLKFIEQAEKFLINSIIGYQTINAFGIGRRLGIFDYLYKKGLKSYRDKKIVSVSFNLKELSNNLNLSIHYLKAWILLSLISGIFEIDTSQKKTLKTAPFVFDLLVDRNNIFYLGNFLALCYDMNPPQDILCHAFETGSFIDKDVNPEIREYGQKDTSKIAPFIERLFSKYFKTHKATLQNQGALLEVGCGYGNNLEYWAKKYRTANIVGIDIDPRSVALAKKKFSHYKWNDRIEIHSISVGNFACTNKNKFDVIIFNQVLHGMNRDEKYRIKIFEDLYTIIKENGLLIVGEHVIPEIFSARLKFNLLEICHQWLELPYGARFYDKKDFIKFIGSTPFKKVELVKEHKEYISPLVSFQRGYFWALRK